MKKNPSSTRSLWLRPMSIFLAFLSSFVILSCGSGDKSPSTTLSAPAPGGDAFTMNCVMLTKAQVQSWVDSGWTKNGDIKEILLQFYSSNASDAASNLQLIAYPGESALVVKKTGSQVLAVDTGCKAVSFTGSIILSNIQVELSKLGILNEDGTLKEFDYIRFTPVKFAKNENYISFSAEVIEKGVPRVGESIQLPPCPPYCCPPYCD